MSTTKYSTIIIAMLFTLLSINSAATVIDNGYYTTDTDTGLDWLDLTVSSPYTVDEINNLSQNESSIFYGWSTAGVNETQLFFQSLGIPLTYGSYSSDQDIDNSIKLASSLLGNTVNLNTDYYENGFLGMVEGAPNGGYYTMGAWSLQEQLMYGIETQPNSAIYTASHVSPWIGTYLVRPSVVPLPAAAWLFGSALLGFFGLSRRKA